MVSASVRKGGLFPCEPPLNSRQRDRWGGVIDGEMPDCRGRDYSGYVPLHRALCGRDNWPEEILDENRQPAHRDDEFFLIEEDMTYEDLQAGFQVVTGEDAEEDAEEEEESQKELNSSEPPADLRMQQEIAAWVQERYGRVIRQLEPGELLKSLISEKTEIRRLEPGELLPGYAEEKIKGRNKNNDRKEEREAKRAYVAEMRRRVNTQKWSKPFRKEVQKVQNWQIEPIERNASRSRTLSSVLFSKPESDEQIEQMLVAKYGDSLNDPIQFSLNK